MLVMLVGQSGQRLDRDGVAREVRVVQVVQQFRRRLVAVVGSMEAPSLLYCWWQLARAGLLRLAEELALLGVGGVGIMVGIIINGGLLLRM